MHLAILVTNTDKSSFAAQHPLDGEKFTRLIHLARPDWQTTAFQIHEGHLPRDLDTFDGALITGSPASTRSGLPWIAPLLELIQQIETAQLPLFGACFGHQAIALALGGGVETNPNGWVHGLIPNQMRARPAWAQQLPADFNLYGSHSEYVARLPAQARESATSTGLNAGFYIGNHIWTSQHHPEMSPEFITALTREMREDLGPERYAQAQDSLSQPADQAAFAESLARFYEQAQ
ncbi:type 1 glutamine amidotransferase [Pseudophaeobacter arcticus]|jgi:GMP synthase-like glutamine amidotransferase|uniref:type 1 glutamine amidotransferase n=1 Tax=Pseudophaeobacter arcticus TaxID=385492 RepID=UPI000423A35B|nr:type 1 glutamine amidotransferase [Pseudophaeobacter arcticus]